MAFSSIRGTGLLPRCACLLAGIKGGSSHSGRRTLAAKVLATTGRVELVQLLLGHAEADHVWPYLDVRKEEIRRAFEVAL